MPTSACLFSGKCCKKKEVIKVNEKQRIDDTTHTIPMLHEVEVAQSKYGKITKTGTTIVHILSEHNVPSIANYITKIILTYLYPRLSTAHFSSHFRYGEKIRIDHLLLSTNHRFLFVGGYTKKTNDCYVQIWDLEINECVRRVTFLGSRTFEVHLSLLMDDNRLIIQYDTYKHRVVESTWNADTDRYEMEEWDNSTEITRSPDSQDEEYSNDANTITVCDNKSADEQQQQQYGQFQDSSNITGWVKMTPDQQWLLACGAYLGVWNVTTGDRQSIIPAVHSIFSENHCIIISTDWVAIGWAPALVIYSLPSLVPVGRLNSNDSSITSCTHVQIPMTFTHSFAVCTFDGDVDLWSCAADFTNAVRMHKILNASSYYVTTCCFITAGTKLLTAGEDTRLTHFSSSMIKIWDVQTGLLIENQKDE